MWEMVTLGANPYPGYSNEEVMDFVVAGETMDAVDNCDGFL